MMEEGTMAWLSDMRMDCACDVMPHVVLGYNDNTVEQAYWLLSPVVITYYFRLKGQDGVRDQYVFSMPFYDIIESWYVTLNPKP